MFAFNCIDIHGNFNVINYETKQHDMVRYDTIRYDTIWYDTIRYGTIRYDTIRYVKFITCLTLLCWDAHIEQLIKKCNSYLFLSSRIKVFLSRRNRILFYNSYILLHLDLCCIIWGYCSSTLEDKLVIFQKRAARVILDCDFYTPSSELFKEQIGKHFQKELHIKKQF